MRRPGVLLVLLVAALAADITPRTGYPAAVRDRDLRHRPPSANGGEVRFQVGDQTVVVSQSRGTVFTVEAPAGTPVSVPAGAARDLHGNVNAAEFTAP